MEVYHLQRLPVNPQLEIEQDLVAGSALLTLSPTASQGKKVVPSSLQTLKKLHLVALKAKFMACPSTYASTHASVKLKIL